VNIKDLKKEYEEGGILRESDSNANACALIGSTTASKLEGKIVEIVTDTAERSSAVLPLVPKILERSETNQVTDTSIDTVISQVPQVHCEAPISSSSYLTPSQFVKVPHWTKCQNSPFDRKQIGNAIYFMLSTVAIGFCIHQWNAPHIAPFLMAFAFFACLGVVFAARPNASFFNSSISLSPFTRKLLRVGALILPIPFFIAGAMDIAASSEISDGYRDYWASHFDSSLQHYTKAAMFAPGNSEAYIGQSNVYYSQDNYAQAIATADKAIALDANNSYGWSDKARAQLALDPTSEEAISNAERAIGLDNENGQAFGALSELYLNTGNFDKALSAANNHVKIHADEAHALQVRAEILEKLGQTEEAAADRLAMKQKSH
jgi:Flp pilus assembly protein TadD